MRSRYDIFEVAPNGVPRWVSSADSLKEAKAQMEALPNPEPGREYVTRDYYSCLVVAHKYSQLPAATIAASTI
jgi:hypothetical protein